MINQWVGVIELFACSVITTHVRDYGDLEVDNRQDHLYLFVETCLYSFERGMFQ